MGRVRGGGRFGGWAVGRTREGLTAEVNLEITTTAGGYQSTKHSLS